MSTPIAPEKAAKREDARHGDGTFGNQLHPEADVTIGTQERPEWLNGWPETLPEPELSFHMGDDNVITTTASIGGDAFVEAWNPGDDVHSLESHAFDVETTSVAEAEAAEEWVKEKHEQIAADLRAEMHSAVERARYRVMAKATGKPAAVSTDELDDIIEANGRAVIQAQKDMELAVTARIARGILEDHPDAASMVLYVTEVDNMGEVVTGVSARDAEGRVLDEYNESDDPQWTGRLGDLPANHGWWEAYIPVKCEEAEDYYTIDLKAAAAWSPGTV